MNQTFQSSFCRFTGPGHWRAVPGLGLVEGGAAGVQRSAVVMENWVDPPITAVEYVARQRKALPELEREVAVVRDKSLSAGDRDLHLATYRSPLPAGDFLVQQQLTTADGPLICTLTVSGRESDLSAWGPLADGMLDSFTVDGRRWAKDIRNEPLLGKAPRSRGQSTEARSIGLAVPEPSGWSWDEATNTLRLGETATITVRRSGLPAASAEECFAGALARLGALQDARASRWHHGETPSGLAYWAIETVGQAGRTWGKTAAVTHREAYIEDEGVVAFTLDAAGDLDVADAAFAEVVAGYSWLPADLQALRTGETWLHAELPGHWMVVGTGVYARMTPTPIVVQALVLPRAQPAAKLGPGQSRALRSAPGVAAVHRDEEESGTLYGRPAYRVTLDYDTADGAAASVRVVMVDGREVSYQLVVQGGIATEVSQTLSLLVAGLDLDPEGE